MKPNKTIFRFAVKYFGFLKHVPLVALVFEGMLKMVTLIRHPQVLDVMDDIENEVGAWPGVTMSNHKYGGLQFNHNNREMGHIHGNGMVDVLLTKKLKEHLITEGRMGDHHTIKNTGWCSFEINSAADKQNAVCLLKESYLLRG